MRLNLRRLGWHQRRGRHQRSRPPNRPGNYRSTSYSLLRPWQVRGRSFGWTPFGRRGLDPQEVADFLDRVADDLAAVYQALGDSRQESARIKDALRTWQSDQARRLVNEGRFH
ncbi:DivIVA domain-containing protein [Micromonospora sp. RTGN7]|uniref:DivIVA domain-containing protein n=1 Tax=Micromonospora sp. RTGN7 TaxID=3016526 RepID=UPI0029FF306D|nr:DivIVA domain-containing protein [Micromonospora sp. RTGN7]